MTSADPARRNNVTISGSGDRAMMFAHGFGCDQAMWRLVAPIFEADFRTILFDHVGAGGSDLSAWDPAKYASLDGYADDVVEVVRDLGVTDVIFVGHSVSAMIGVLASIKAPELFSGLVLVGPSPRYVDTADYVGGFSQDQVDELLAFLAENPMAWSQTMAPMIMGNADRPALGDELTQSFCRADPGIALHFARATFTSDNRDDLAKATTRALILQCRDDVIAPEVVGDYVARQMPNSRLMRLSATGHCPNLSAPDEVIAAIRTFI